MEKIIAEYVWLDNNNGIRSKIRVLPMDTIKDGQIPLWNFDGSVIGQETNSTSEMVIRPVQTFNHPFFDNGIIVMCDVHMLLDNGELKAHISNTRAKHNSMFENHSNQEPLYSLEQEYYILERGDNAPYGIVPNRRNVARYYCGNQYNLMPGRRIAEAHLQACLQAGLAVSGIHAEVGPSQWEYVIGPVIGLEAADQLWVSRFLLYRIAEKSGVDISFHPKPLGEDLPGNGCHINFSTAGTRGDNGIEEIERILGNLKSTHDLYISHCGEDTTKRLTGDHETSRSQTFSWNVAGRDSSIRIPKDTAINKQGYFEDRRPSGNMDPYVLCGYLFAAVVKNIEN